MVSRRNFLELAVATTVAGGALGLSQDGAAAATETAWSSATWRELEGTTIRAVDAAGASHSVRVGAVHAYAKQSRVTGEAFRVQLTAARGRLPDGLYRLRGGVSGQVSLIEGEPGSAGLVVNTVRAVR
ncbi:hypothetical protein [Jatrophihabitans sp.]|uniref:hypothetical protein n=1 Tax=Jatrophihabitans sp. TaxID=1932789 RepID=UPI0030C768AA|nr:hypothetical protein [Jatrophihabitans sp.]